ncbi:MAG: hypothetical protein ACTSSE_05225 [Candidatus Thorarchaeota archaeon]
MSKFVQLTMNGNIIPIPKENTAYPMIVTIIPAVDGLSFRHLTSVRKTVAVNIIPANIIMLVPGSDDDRKISNCTS